MMPVAAVLNVHSWKGRNAVEIGENQVSATLVCDVCMGYVPLVSFTVVYFHSRYCKVQKAFRDIQSFHWIRPSTKDYDRADKCTRTEDQILSFTVIIFIENTSFNLHCDRSCHYQRDHHHASPLKPTWTSSHHNHIIITIKGTNSIEIIGTIIITIIITMTKIINIITAVMLVTIIEIICFIFVIHSKKEASALYSEKFECSIRLSQWFLVQNSNSWNSRCRHSGFSCVCKGKTTRYMATFLHNIYVEGCGKAGITDGCLKRAEQLFTFTCLDTHRFHSLESCYDNNFGRNFVYKFGRNH